MAQLAEIRVADTACGSGGFLIKVLRAFWRHYQRIDSACAWVQKILKPDNGELYLAELPPNVEAALAFRRRHHLDNHRVLIAQILLRHIFGVKSFFQTSVTLTAIVSFLAALGMTPLL